MRLLAIASSLPHTVFIVFIFCDPVTSCVLDPSGQEISMLSVIINQAGIGFRRLWPYL